MKRRPKRKFFTMRLIPHLQESVTRRSMASSYRSGRVKTSRTIPGAEGRAGMAAMLPSIPMSSIFKRSAPIFPAICRNMRPRYGIVEVQPISAARGSKPAANQIDTLFEGAGHLKLRLQTNHDGKRAVARVMTAIAEAASARSPSRGCSRVGELLQPH
jgi:hypothetical protein